MAPVSISAHIGGAVLSFVFEDGDGIISLSAIGAGKPIVLRLSPALNFRPAYLWVEDHFAPDMWPAANATLSHFEDMRRILQIQGGE